MAAERPTVNVRPARLLILGDALERAIRDIAAIHEQCTKLGLPTGWFDVSDLELLQRRVTAELLNGPAPEVHRVALDLQDFQALVRGREVQRPGVRMVLRDIGWTLMLDEINNAAVEASRRVRTEERTDG